MLDTNIFVSGIHWTGASRVVLDAWKRGTFELVVSAPILAEIVRTLQDFKLKLDDDEFLWWYTTVVETAIFVSSVQKISIVEDPDDDKFIEAAVAANASYILSQDKHLLKIGVYKNVHIVTPEHFVALLTKNT